MTFQEALDELGIQISAGSEGARRAYLRLLKTRKPERDPEGFKRLREAYELASAHLEHLDVLQDAPVAVTRFDLSDTTPRSSEKPSLNFDALARRHELLLTAYEHRTLCSTHSSLQAVNVAHRLCDRKLPKVAAEILIHLIEQVPSDEPRHLPVRALIKQVCRLHAAGAVTQGNEVKERFEDWLEASHREFEVLTGGTAAMWLLTRELCLVPDEISIDARRALVSLILEEQHEEAEEVFVRLFRKDPEQTYRLKELLDQHAPQLSSFLNLPARPHSNSTRANASFDYRWLVLTIIVFLWLVWRMR